MTNLKKLLKSERAYKTLLITSFACFIFILCWCIIFKMGNNNDINKMFNGKQGAFSLKKRFNVGLQSTFIKGRIVSARQLRDALLNVLVFLPFGIYLPLIFKKNKLIKTLIVAVFTTIIFELFQLFLIWGCFTVDDLVANTLGAIVGLFFYFIIVKHLNCRLITAINFLIVLIAVPICLYALFGIFQDFAFYRDLLIALPTKY